MLPRCLVLLLCALAWPATAAERSTPILPLAQVKPGMVGEARTVFAGTAPESFKVRVVSILRNFMPKLDVILVRAEDPRVEASGVAAGMSGSPVYIDGKLVGAIAYGWAFVKEPLAGVTPIEAMLAERNRPDRPPPDPLAVPPQDVPPHADRSGGSGDHARLQPVAIPLSVSGASEASLAYMGEELQAFGMRPVRAGGAGSNPPTGKAPATTLVPGSAIGVALISGDMSTTAMGTLTHRDGKQVFAFGHAMFGVGAVNLPMVQGEIHAIIPSLASSLKLSSPLTEIGAVTDDSKSGIIGIIGGRAGTVPLQVRVISKGVRKPAFSVAIARHRKLLPMLTTTAVSTALAEAVPDVTDMIADVTTRLFIRGFPPLELRDQILSRATLAPRVLAMSHGMRALVELLKNPFAPAVVDRIEVNARVDFRAGSAEITGLASPGGDVRAGKRLPLKVTLRPYGGEEIVEDLPIEVPATLAGRRVKIEVAGGAQVKPEIPRAESLGMLIENLRTFYPASSLIVSLTTLEDGVTLRGRVIRNLPPSALDTLRPAAQSRSASGYHVVQRTAFARDRIFTGRKAITVEVSEKNSP